MKSWSVGGLRSWVVLAAMTAAMTASAATCYRAEMTFAADAVDAALTDYPVLVRVSESAVSGFSYADCAANGANVWFTSDAEGGNPLPHEVDTWKTDGESLFWVKVPTVENGGKFYMFWGDATPPANDPTQVWSDYVCVFHFNEPGGTNAFDSTANHLDANAFSDDAAAFTEVAGMIGSGRSKTVTTSFTIPDYSSLAVGSQFTLSCYIRATERTAYESFWAHKSAWNVGNGYQCNMQNSNTSVFLTGSGATNTSNTQIPNVVNAWTSLTLVYNNTSLKAYNKGGEVSSRTIEATGEYAAPLRFDGFKGIADEMRLRKGAVSAAWVKADYQQTQRTDFVAAGTVEVLGGDDTILVGATPERFGTASPAYGSVSGLAAGAEVPFSVATPVALEQGVRAVCTGWKLYDIDGALLDQGDTASFTYTHPTPAAYRKLVWQWKYQCLVEASAAANGSVSMSEEWVDRGGTFTVTATPAGSEYALRRWTDETDAVVGTDATLSMTITSPKTFTSHFTDAIYVSPNGDDEFGEGTSVNPYQTIAKALSVSSNSTILLADGIYTVTAQIAITDGTAICGLNPGAKAIVKCTTQLSGDIGAPSSLFKLSHADAMLRNIALTSTQARGVWLEQAGLVENCVITNCRTIYCNGPAGGGVLMNKGGTVRNTYFDGNTTHSSGGNDAKGHQVYCLQGGTVENCIITRGGTSGDSASSTAAVYLDQGGVIRNCLIYRNTTGHINAARPTAVYFNNGGTMENCTVAGNYHNGSTVTPAVYIQWNGTIRNSIISGNYIATGEKNFGYYGNYAIDHTCCTPLLNGTGNTDKDPSFVDAANYDYHLNLSAAVDGGASRDWMDRLTDLDGNARVWGAAPDMGCYEFSAPGLACGFDVATAGVLGTDTITLTSRVAGDSPANLTYRWKLTDQAGVEIVREGGDELAVLELPVTVGIYDVELTISNGIDAPASLLRPAIFMVYPSDIYVATDGANAYPYNSYANGATNLQEALDAALDGTVIHVGPGWHRVSDTLMINKGVSIISRDGPGSTFVRAPAKTTGMAALVVGHRDAYVSGLTINGKEADGTQTQKWGGLSITSAGGTVTNCVICNHKTVNNSVHGAGARLEGGTVVDCVFTNNFLQCSGGWGGQGGAIQMTGGNAVVDRCVVASNKVDAGSVSYGGGVYMSAGLVRNSLVIGNYCVSYGGGAAVTGGRFVNNTVVCNRAGSIKGGVYQSGGTVADCLVYNSSANGVKEDIDDPGFENAEAGDYHLNPASPAIDAGTSEYAGELDLERNPRVSGTAADKGCYEYDQSRFSIGIKYEKIGGSFAPMDVEFSASATPSTVVLDAAKTWWTFDGTEPSAENHAAVGTVVTNTLPPGQYTVRFKTVYNETTYAIDNEDWLLLYGETVYLVKENANAKPPYATPETAATSLSSALSYAIAGSTLVIGDGTFYDLGSTHVIARQLTIRSVNGPEKTTIGSTSAMKNRPFNLNNAEAVISGITFDHCYNWEKGGAIQMSAGLVTNCVFKNGYTQNNGGAGVYATGGTIVDCEFRNNYLQYSDQSGVALMLTGASALADRCRIEKSTNGNKAGNGAVYVEKGTLRNSLVAYNTLSKNSGILVGAAGVVENCTVVSNKSTTAGAWAGIGTVAGSQVRNTISWGNLDSTAAVANTAGGGTFDHCATDGTDPRFRNIANGDWRLRNSFGSPCVNQGVKLDWMTEGSVDLGGNPRVKGLLPDVGCYENPFRGTSILVR